MCECQGNPLARVTLALGLPYLLVNRALSKHFAQYVVSVGYWGISDLKPGIIFFFNGVQDGREYNYLVTPSQK